jgi:succinyl-diaminopimelate desuccinylase
MSIDPRDPVAVAQALIRCPSVTPTEGGALALLQNLLTPLGFSIERPVFSEDGTPDVENLYARRGDGPALVFAGHTDVVPPGDVSRWRSGPFSGEIVDGELCGRGAVDMKGAIACMVAAVARRPDAAPVAFLIAGDEEGPAINGTRKLLDWAVAHGEAFSGCLLGEPSNPTALGDEIKIGRRGSLSGTAVIRGVQGHVAYPDRADNPVRKLPRALAALMDRPFDSGTEVFQPSNLEVVGVSSGAGAFNVIPNEATLTFNIRYNDRHTRETLIPEITRRLEAAVGADDVSVVFEPPTGDAFMTEPGPLTELVTAAIEAETGRRPKLSTSGGTSDARFIRFFCPVVEFGLVGRTMHQIDERVPLADLEALTRIYERVLEAAR